MQDIKTFNSKCALRLTRPIRGMIDAHACYSSRATWPTGLIYVKSTGEVMPIKEVVERIPRDMRMLHTVDLGKNLVGRNIMMYNSNREAMDDLDRNNMPSLIVAATSDMEK